MWCNKNGNCPLIQNGHSRASLKVKLTCSKSLLDEGEPVARPDQMNVTPGQSAPLTGELDRQLGWFTGTFCQLEPAQQSPNSCRRQIVYGAVTALMVLMVVFFFFFLCFKIEICNTFSN